MACEGIGSWSLFTIVLFVTLLFCFTKTCGAFSPVSPMASHAIGSRSSNVRKFTPRPISRRSIELIAMAKGKKGGKKKKGGQKKTAVSLVFEPTPTESAKMRELAEMLVTSYKSVTGKDIFETGRVSLFQEGSSDVAKRLWKHPVAVMVVESPEVKPSDPDEDEAATEGNAEEQTVAEDVDLCAYANLAACETYGYLGKDGWKSIIDKPCADLVADVPKGKYESGYAKKLKMMADGAPPVSIADASRWKIEKMVFEDGKVGMKKLGVAYAWESWVLEDGTICRPGGIREDPPIPDDQLEAAIAEKGAFIRKLKEEDGFKNSDEEVQDAVAELLELKERLAENYQNNVISDLKK